VTVHSPVCFLTEKQKRILSSAFSTLRITRRFHILWTVASTVTCRHDSWGFPCRCNLGDNGLSPGFPPDFRSTEWPLHWTERNLTLHSYQMHSNGYFTRNQRFSQDFFL